VRAGLAPWIRRDSSISLLVAFYLVKPDPITQPRTRGSADRPSPEIIPGNSPGKVILHKTEIFSVGTACEDATTWSDARSALPPP
jgi:hypothetical protein